MEVVASWADQVDNLSLPLPNTVTQPPVTTAHLAEFSIAKKHADSPPAQNIRLPFSDTRFRRVTFAAKGYSRLGASFYGPDRMLSTDSEADRYVVDFLATAPPIAPDVEAVLPNLKWAIQDNRRVRTMGLTLVLNRQWFSSGNDERLAVLGGPAADVGNPCALRTLDPKLDENTISSWGSWPTGSSPARHTSNSPRLLTRSTCCWTTIPIPPTPPIPSRRPADQSPSARPNIRPRSISRFNQQDGQWYVNVSCQAPPAYGATVRLIVARHQKHALPGCALSPLTVCDFCLLSPERSVLIQRSGLFNRTVTISLQGVAPYDKDGKLLTKIEVFLTENQHNDFDWDTETPIPPDNGFTPSKTLLWQKTYHQELLDTPTFVIRESELYPPPKTPPFCSPATCTSMASR